MTNKKEQARNLRIKGKSLTDISKSLNTGKSTIRYWCKDIILSKEQNKQLEKQRIKKAYAGSLEFSKKCK